MKNVRFKILVFLELLSGPDRNYTAPLVSPDFAFYRLTFIFHVRKDILDQSLIQTRKGLICMLRSYLIFNYDCGSRGNSLYILSSFWRLRIDIKSISFADFSKTRRHWTWLKSYTVILKQPKNSRQIWRRFVPGLENSEENSKVQLKDLVVNMFKKVFVISEVS